MTPPGNEPPVSQPGPNRPNTPEYSVSELSNAVKRALEDGFGYVRLKGEISGFRGVHASGHCYFALKDDKAKIEAVVWRMTYQRLRFKPAEGLEVIAQGRVTTFPGSSKYQIVIEALEPAGTGALMALLEERKRKLAAEGLFESTRKRALPFLPKVVGIITSPTGAVIRDMLHGFDERFPARVLLWPVRVQGEGCAQEVAAAIRGFNGLAAGGVIARPDVLIVARGGGSLEDLWGFNEEIVVRAAAESSIPLISAVGHETDWTLIDLVADARAPTPTKAAEWAVPKFSDLVDALDKFAVRQRTGMRRVLSDTRTHLKAAARGLPRLQDLVALPRQRFDAATGRLTQGLLGLTGRKGTRLAQSAGRLTHPRTAVRLARQKFSAVAPRLQRGLIANTQTLHTRFVRAADKLRPTSLTQRVGLGRERLATLDRRADQAFVLRLSMRRRVLHGQAALLNSLSYHAVLARGYAVVRDAAGTPVRLAASVASGAPLNIEFADGRVDALAQGAGKAPLAGMPASAGSPGEPAASPSRNGPADKGRRSASQAATQGTQAPRPRRSGGDGGSGGGAGGQGSLF